MGLIKVELIKENFLEVSFPGLKVELWANEKSQGTVGAGVALLSEANW